MRKWSVLLMLGLLAGCSENAVKDAVRDSLVDPDSAKFGDVAFSESGERACVGVNAKNRMGGYTGETQMVVAQGEDGEWVTLSDSEQSAESCLEMINTIEEMAAS